MPRPPSTELRPWEPLYHAVAAGMWLYTRTVFHVETLGHLEPTEGLLIASTHRAETDVPLLCPSFYGLGRYFSRPHAPRLAFAAREDMFERGFFAGFPGALPLAARRLLYPLEAGRWLPRVRVHPIPYPSISQLRLGRALERLPAGVPLAEILPGEIVEQFERRSLELGLPPARTVGEVRRGGFADILWRFCTREELSDPIFEQLWRERSTEGAAALRRLIEHLRSSGEMLLIFPEGRPSPDGAIGPLQPGLELLVRRGRPPGIVLVAVAYDHLVDGRPRALVTCGRTLPSRAAGVEQAVLAGLREATPLTTGQIVARELRRAAAEGRPAIRLEELAARAGEEVDRAADEGRWIEPDLRGRRRSGRLELALSAVVRRGLATVGDGMLRLDAGRVLADPLVGRLARERASAHGLEEP